MQCVPPQRSVVRQCVKVCVWRWNNPFHNSVADHAPRGHLCVAMILRLDLPFFLLFLILGFDSKPSCKSQFCKAATLPVCLHHHSSRLTRPLSPDDCYSKPISLHINAQLLAVSLVDTDSGDLQHSGHTYCCGQNGSRCHSCTV